MWIRKHLSLLSLLVDSPDDQKAAIVKTLTSTQLRAVQEAIYNVLKENCPINDKLKKKLEQHKINIRRLVSKDLTRQQQQRLLVKHSNFASDSETCDRVSIDDIIVITCARK